MAGFRERKYTNEDGNTRRFGSTISPNVDGRSRAAGFGGLETGDDGNLRQASYQSVYGKAPSADQAQANPIRDVYADIPRPNVAQSQGGAGMAALAKAGEKAIDAYMKQRTSPGWPQFETIGPATGSTQLPGVQTSGAFTAPVPDMQSGIGVTDLESGTTVSPVQDYGAGIEFNSIPGDAIPGAYSTDGLGFDAWSGADAGLDAAGSAFDIGGVGGYVGPFMKLASGDVGGAIKQGAGVAIGTAIGGPVGGFIGGLIGGDCFITEATMAGIGVQGPELEQSEPLQVLRWFRDNVMMSSPQGKNLVQQYYLMAPEVVEAVNQRPDAMQVYQAIYGQYLKPAVEAVKAGDYQKALSIYSEMINFVAPFAAEMDPGVGEDLSESAAMVQADPGMQAQIAAPEGEPQGAPPFMRNIIARR